MNNQILSGDGNRLELIKSLDDLVNYAESLERYFKDNWDFKRYKKPEVIRAAKELLKPYQDEGK